VIVNQGALEPTKMCLFGRMAGSSTSVPMATWTKAPSRTTEYSSEPQILQCVSLLLSSPKIIRPSLPLVTASFSRSMPANGLKAEPVVRRQLEQWQFAAYTNSSATA
jgi:hypothetical protein